MRAGYAVVSLVAALAACQPAAPAGLSAADQAAVRAADDAAARHIIAKDWAGWAGDFTEDAILMPNNGDPVTGRAGIQAWASGFPPFSDFKVSLEEVEGRGDLAYGRGTYSMMITPPGAQAPVHDHGKYLAIYRKQADGSWKASRDIFNSNVPLPAPPAPVK